MHLFFFWESEAQRSLCFPAHSSDFGDDENVDDDFDDFADGRGGHNDTARRLTKDDDNDVPCL